MTRWRRNPKPKPPPSFEPHECVTVNVDTATRSGWAAFAKGEYIESGEVPLDIEPICKVIKSAMLIADIAEVPCVLVLERPFGQARGRARGGSDKGRALWRACWRQCRGVTRRIVSVYPATWRARVLGGEMSNAKRDVVREVEIATADKIKLDAAKIDKPPTNAAPDEAAAICIGLWSARAGEVGAVLPKRAA